MKNVMIESITFNYWDIKLTPMRLYGTGAAKNGRSPSSGARAKTISLLTKITIHSSGSRTSLSHSGWFWALGRNKSM